MFHCIGYTFYIYELWATFTCPEKQRVPWIHSTEDTFFIIQDFWATSACPVKQSCTGIFHCIEYTFYIQDFWVTCACPEKQSCPGIFHCIEYVFFVIQDFWTTCACPEIFHTRGAAAPPDPSPRTPMRLNISNSWKAAAKTVRMVTMCVKFQCLTLNNWGKRFETYRKTISIGLLMIRTWKCESSRFNLA